LQDNQDPAAPHRVPRHPRAWQVAAVAGHGLVALVAWRAGLAWGFAALVLLHLGFVWGTLRPGSRLFGPVLRRLPTDERVAWLTIDDGPSDDTPAVLDLLDRHGARATFFLVGERAAARPALVRAITARGHEVANHSHRHPQARFWRLGPKAMRREVLEAQEVLARLAGVPPRWFRAVVGHANPFVHAPLAEAGLARVAWSARGYDAVEADPQRVVRRIARDLQPGAIVLLHEGAPHGRSVEAVAAVLALLDARGYRAVLPAGPVSLRPPASC
jgi:peptidoglycan/xylan/chitin deacetylase (PgdA/CDA1 family)